MIGLGYRDLHPDDDLEVEDRRHALPHHEQRRQAAAKDAP